MVGLIYWPLVRSKWMVRPTDLYIWNQDIWRLWSVGETVRTWKGTDIYRYKNGGTTSTLVFDAALSETDILLWKSLWLTTWSPNRVMDWSDLYNKPMSSFWVEFRTNWPVQGGCGWYWWVVTKRFLVSGGVVSAGEFSGNLVAIVSVASKKYSCWTILDFPLENSKVYISSNWSGGAMLSIFYGWVIHWLKIIWQYLK